LVFPKLVKYFFSKPYLQVLCFWAKHYEWGCDCLYWYVFPKSLGNERWLSLIKPRFIPVLQFTPS